MERERKTCSNRPWVRLKPKPATQETLARLVPPAPAPAPVPSRFIPQTLGCVLCRPSWGNWAAVGVFWQDSNAGLRVVQAEQGFFLQHQVRYVRIYSQWRLRVPGVQREGPVLGGKALAHTLLQPIRANYYTQSRNPCCASLTHLMHPGRVQGNRWENNN